MIPHLRDDAPDPASGLLEARITVLEAQLADALAKLARFEEMLGLNRVIPYALPLGDPGVVTLPHIIGPSPLEPTPLPLYHEIMPTYVEPLYVPHDPFRYPTTGDPVPEHLKPTTTTPWRYPIGIGPQLGDPVAPAYPLVGPNLSPFTVTCTSEPVYNSAAGASPPA